MNIKLLVILLISILSIGLEAQSAEVLSMSVVGGPLVSSSSQDYDRKIGILAGALFDFSTGPMAWEIEALAAKRSYEGANQLKVDGIHAQVGAIMRVYVNLGRTLSMGIGPYIAKPLKDQDSIRSDQLEAGGALSVRWDSGHFATMGPFGIGLASEVRFTGGKVVSGTPKNSYFDGAFLLGLRFGIL